MPTFLKGYDNYDIICRRNIEFNVMQFFEPLFRKPWLVDPHSDAFLQQQSGKYNPVHLVRHNNTNNNNNRNNNNNNNDRQKSGHNRETCLIFGNHLQTCKNKVVRRIETLNDRMRRAKSHKVVLKLVCQRFSLTIDVIIVEQLVIMRNNRCITSLV